MTKKTIIIQLDDSDHGDRQIKEMVKDMVEGLGYAVAIIENSTILETAQHYQKIMEAFYALDDSELFEYLEVAEGYDEVEIRKLINALYGKEQYDPLWYVEKDEEE